MTVLLWIIIGLLLIVLLTTIFNVLTAPVLKNGPSPEKKIPVSVLIPARNEQANISDCLQSLLKQDYSDMEIRVLDDHSTDETAKIVQSFAENHSHIKLIRGKELPAGWTGKNWACHQLAEQAAGEVFIFTDADNRHAGNAVSKTVGWMQKYRLDLLSAFPQQYTQTLFEKLIVPTVYMTVYSYLPLWFTYFIPHPSLAAANGQWLAFNRGAYKRSGGHQTAKNQVVEDTWLARTVKQQGMKTLTTAGTGGVFARMYQNSSEVWHGFSKNLYGLMGYKMIPAFLMLTLMGLAYILPYVLMVILPFMKLVWVALLLNILIRTSLSLKYKQPFLNVFFHPIAILLTMIIAVNSIRLFRKGQLSWKGRTITIEENP